MIKSVDVYLWGTHIGTLFQDSEDVSASFEYDSQFIKSGIEVSPFKMPLSNRIYTFKELSRIESFHGLPGLLADSLPDRFGNAVIDSWLNSKGYSIDNFSALDRLCYTGKRGMGALEFVPSSGPESMNDEINVSEMVSFASDIIRNRDKKAYSEKNVTKAQLIEIGSSAGGARAKAVIAWNSETGSVRSGQIEAGSGYDYWIIKFDGIDGNGDHGEEDKKQYTLIEYAYYLMAIDLGIEMSECKILEKDGLSHFMTKRFDRQNGDKIHMQTLSALGHYDYNTPGECSYEAYAQYARKLSIGATGIEQIFKRMVFSDLAKNYDDHVKNFAFLMNRQGVWSIAPAYDLCFAYVPGNRWISKHQMTINGKSIDISENDLIQCGTNMGMNVRKCKSIIEETRKVVSNWMDYAEKAHITEKRAKEIYKYLEM